MVDAGQKLLISFGALAFLPVFLVSLLLFFLFPSVVMKQPLDVLTLLGSWVGFDLILLAFFSVWSTNNDWMQFALGKKMAVLDLNSTGISPMYTATVKRQTEEGITVETNVNGIKEERVYDRNIIHRVAAPLNIFMRKVKGKTPDEPSKYLFEIPQKDFDEAQFKLDTRTFLVRNGITGMFWTKNALGENEKTMQLENLSATELWEVRKMTSEMRALNQHMMNQLGSKFSGFLASPYLSVIILVVVIAAVAFVAISFGPQVLQSLGFISKAPAASAVSNLPVTPGV